MNIISSLCQTNGTWDTRDDLALPNRTNGYNAVVQVYRLSFWVTKFLYVISCILSCSIAYQK